MGVSRAALSQHLKTLEQRLNVRLLHRTTRDMSLTEEGQRLFDALQGALASVERALAEPSGLIRINTSRVAAQALLEPHLAEFLARYPRLRVELVLADGFSSIVADGMDAGIRLGESLDEYMVAVPITPMVRMAVVGAPGYFERHGTPAEPADLMRHNCLAYRFTSSGAIDRWSFTSPDAEGRTIVLEPQGNAVFNDDESILRACAAGRGAGQAPGPVRAPAPGQRRAGARAAALVRAVSGVFPLRALARADARQDTGADGLPGGEARGAAVIRSAHHGRVRQLVAARSGLPGGGGEVLHQQGRDFGQGQGQPVLVAALAEGLRHVIGHVAPGAGGNGVG